MKHPIDLVNEEPLKIRLKSDNPNIVFDIYDESDGDKIFDGSIAERPNIWRVNGVNEKGYSIKVYNAEKEKIASGTMDYIIEVSRSD